VDLAEVSRGYDGWPEAREQKPSIRGIQVDEATWNRIVGRGDSQLGSSGHGHGRVRQSSVDLDAIGDRQRLGSGAQGQDHERCDH
jgi:hypothetical protein